jgi:hypothetical protein
MAGRRYTRDNRGRFATVGATARGGRLRTEAGNKRATVTGKIEGAVPRGTVRPGRRSAKPAPPAAAAPASARQRVRGNFRPKNLITRADPKSSAGYGKDAAANVAEARRRIEATGASSALKSNKRSSTVAHVSEKTPNTVHVNASHTAWKDPRSNMIKNRRENMFSTSSANHYAAHELGHIKNPTNQKAPSWDVQLRGKGQIYADADKVVGAKRVARRVSKYAMQNPAEFTAEVAAGLSLGKKYDREVMRQYRAINGRRARSVRSQLNK